VEQVRVSVVPTELNGLLIAQQVDHGLHLLKVQVPIKALPISRRGGGIRERSIFVELQVGIKALPEKLNSSVIIWTANGGFIRRDVVPFPSHRNLQKS
jgi:hypothetical protein